MDDALVQDDGIDLISGVHMRNCLHKCNRTQVSPATNEEAEGIEIVTSLLPNLDWSSS